MPEETQNKEIVRRFVEGLYAHGNVEVFEELIADDAYVAGVGGEVHGDTDKLKEMASRLHSMLHEAAPDIRFQIDELIAEGDSVAARFTERGTLTGPYVAGPNRIEPTGRSFEVTAMEFFHLEDGKIKERWATRDRLGFLQQVGAQIQIG